MRRFTPLLVVFLSHIYASPQYERVHMKDVTSLVLDSSQYTTGRRSAPVKQLACIGGPCHLAPSRAICFQKGWDGRDAVWECNADMVGAKFGRLEVLCEGFSSPDDPYILHGSCGLQYTLESTAPEKLEVDTSVQFPATTDRVLLKDITTLVLTAGEKTAHRRSRAVPQLKCTAGPCERAPSRVVCQQIGWDGRNPNWDCTATMTGARFRKLDVVCEGYDSPDDPYVLAGSCGLEYTLEATGHQTASRHLTSESSSYDSTGDFMTSACVVTLITLIYCCYSGVSGRSGSAGNVNPAENRHFPLGQGPNALLRAGFGGPGRAAPVDLGQPPEYHGPGVQGGDKGNAGGGGMGFLHGLAGGSALGYLASRWQRHAAEQEAPPAVAHVRPAHSSGHAAVAGSDVQTGYATTKRRGEDSWLGGLVGSSSSSRAAAPSAPSQSAARPAAAPEPAGSDVQTGYATTKRRGDDSLWSRLTGSGSAAAVVSEPPVSSATSQPAPVSAAAPEQPDVQTGFAGTKRRGDDSIISRFIGTTPTPATIVTPPVGSATSHQATSTRLAPSSTADVDPNVQTGYATTKRRGDKSDTDSSLAAASQMRSERLAAQMGTFDEDTSATQSGYATTKRR